MSDRRAASVAGVQSEGREEAKLRVMRGRTAHGRSTRRNRPRAGGEGSEQRQDGLWVMV